MRACVYILAASLWSCAATPTVADCSLDDETACVEYAATIDDAPQPPHGRLILGLSARAAQLDGERAFDYHARIVELVEASDSVDSRVGRHASASFLAMAEHDLSLLDAFDWDGDLNSGIEQTSELQTRLQRRAEFVVNHGDLRQQAAGAWTITRGLERHADLLVNVEIPPELTSPAEAAFEKKLGDLANSFRREANRFRRGVITHCTRHGLSTPSCEAARQQ